VVTDDSISSFLSLPSSAQSFFCFTNRPKNGKAKASASSEASSLAA